MPLEYPPAPPTLSGDQLSISRFLASPTMVWRRMADLAKNRFVSDFVYGLPAIPAPGSQIYSPDQQPLLLSTQPSAVSPGAEYPRAEMPTGAAAIAQIAKWGVTVPLTDESIGRVPGLGGSSLVDQAMAFIVTTLAALVDRLAMTALDAAVTNTASTVALWKTVASSDPVQDVTVARAKIVKGTVDASGTFPGSGFTPDTIVCSDLNAAYLISSAKIQAAIARQVDAMVQGDPHNPTLAGMRIAPTGMLPTPTRAFVVDSSKFGYFAYEVIVSPEYRGDAATGIQTAARRDPDGNDKWLITGRRPVVPVPANPGAGFMVSGLTE